MAKDWMKFYYAQPQPERFVDEVRSLAKKGVLSNPESAFPLVIFLSSVIAANGARVQAWLDALLDLAPADLQTLQRAASLSRTPEAHAYMIARRRHDVREREASLRQRLMNNLSFST